MPNSLHQSLHYSAEEDLVQHPMIISVVIRMNMKKLFHFFLTKLTLCMYIFHEGPGRAQTVEVWYFDWSAPRALMYLYDNDGMIIAV